MATLKLEIVTPEARTYSEDVDYVLIPGVEGELGVYPGHVPLMTQLAPGELKATRGGKDEYLAVGSGFVEITQERVAVLTDMAVKEDDIVEADVQAALERAQKALKEAPADGEAQAAAEAALQKQLAQLKVKRRRQA